MQADHHLTQFLNTALAVHQSGDYDQAATLYRQILAHYPGQADALFLFGVLHHQLGRHQDAVNLLLKAIAKNKRNADWHNTLGEAYRALGQIDEAIRAYRRALQIAPGLVEALGNLGLALQDQGKLIEAAQCYEKVLRANSKVLPALINLGSVYQEQGKYPEALARYQSALEVDPNCNDAHFNLGLLHHEQRRYTDALKHLQLATQLAPDNPNAWLALGKTYIKLAQHEHARRALEQALALHPDYPEADFTARPSDAAKQCLLGNILWQLGKKSEAMVCFKQAIALKADHVEAMLNLGSLLFAEGQLEAADHLFDRVITLQPGHIDAYLNRGLILQQQDELGAARESLMMVLRQRPGYPRAEICLGGILLNMGLLEESLLHTRRGVEAMPDDSHMHSNLLLALNYTNRPAEQVFREHLDFGKRFAGYIRGTPRAWPNDCETDRAIRIGYVSPDFRTHSVAYFIEPILAFHDRSRFEVFCYADVSQGDAVTERLQRNPVNWRDIHQLSDQQIFELIQEDGIDILVDLAGHTGGNRLAVFARKPAPVQVSYLGYPNTTGLTEMDYRVTDAWADPEGLTDPFYTEKLIRLPHGFLCYQPEAESPLVTDLPALARGHVTFGSFNNLTKVTDAMIALWSRVLNAVPNSLFILKSKALADKTVQTRIARLFTEQGVDQSRLKLLAQIPLKEGHLAAYHGIDIALDTFPYHGATTTFEALWMGAPVVTLAGEAHVARVGVSILSRMELPELIAKTPEDYVSIAVELAGDLPKLQELRQTMRQRMEAHGLLDGTIITQELEAAYADMWRGVPRNVPYQ